MPGDARDPNTRVQRLQPLRQRRRRRHRNRNRRPSPRRSDANLHADRNSRHQYSHSPHGRNAAGPDADRRAALGDPAIGTAVDRPRVPRAHQPDTDAGRQDAGRRAGSASGRSTRRVLSPGRQEFLDITDRASSRRSEEGCWAWLDPANAERIYVYYSAADPRRSVVSRFAISVDGARAEPDSELVILEVGQPYANHNGGQIAFGPDGYLYIGLGDGGSAGDPMGSGQDTSTLLGSILRIDVSQSGRGHLYAIPADNPFASGGGRGEIWAYGLRNPWRFSFDRKTGELWAGDVGQNRWEEIDLIRRGGNYGWNLLEGNHCFSARDCDPTGTVPPVWEYSLDGQPCSVIGGYVYRGSAIPWLRGRLRVRRLLLRRGVRAAVRGWTGNGTQAAGRYWPAHHVVRRGQRW